MTYSLEAQIRAARKVQKAASDLSAACVEDLRIPQEVAPFARFYDRTVLQQESDVEMTVLIGKLS